MPPVKFSIALSEKLNRQLIEAAGLDDRSRNYLIVKILSENISKYLKKVKK